MRCPRDVRGRGRARERDGESGQIMLLTSMFVAFALVLVAVVVSATAVHLDRKRLFDLADASALDAADAMPVEAVYQGGLADPLEGGVLVLSDADVESSVRSFLVAHPAMLARLDDVTIVEAATPDGRTADVQLAARSRPVLVSWVTQLWSDGIIVRAESSARAW